MPTWRQCGFPAGSRWNTPSPAGGRSGRDWTGCAGWISARACRCARSRPTRGSGTTLAGSGPKMRKHVGFESWVERGHLVALDFAPEVTAIVSQPFWLCWRTPAGKPARHAPDFFARLADGGALVIDSRPRYVADDEDRQAFAATRQACEMLGWTYAVCGAMDPVVAANHRWIAGYRHPRCGDPATEARLLEAFGPGLPLMEGAEAAGDPLATLPVLFHLMWRRQLVAGLSLVLSHRTVVRRAGRG